MHLTFSIYFTVQLILNHTACHIILEPFLLKRLSVGPFWPSGLARLSHFLLCWDPGLPQGRAE